MKNNKKGFTLIELLVVIAIIGLLSTLAVVSLNSARVKARDARRMSDLKQISTAMELYFSENNEYPATPLAPAVCGANGVIAAATGGDICPPPNNPIADDDNTYLNSLPSDPQYDSATAGSNYEWNGDDSTYCIQADLEGSDTDYFVCEDGSCFTTDTPC